MFLQSTERTTMGYSYMVVRIDGEVSGSKVYRGENAVGTFLSDILQEEVKIREFSRKKADCDGARRLGKIQKCN